MSQSKTEYHIDWIISLVDKIIQTKEIPESSQNYIDLNWVKFHAKNIASKCPDCKGSSGITGEIE